MKIGEVIDYIMGLQEICHSKGIMLEGDVRVVIALILKWYFASHYSTSYLELKEEPK